MSQRLSGVLLHPTSLPGDQGIGSLGAQARAFVTWLGTAGQALWQILPLGPTGYGNSPYACASAFAGNPWMIDLAALADRGWLDAAAVALPGKRPADRVDFDAVIAHKRAALMEVYGRFVREARPIERAAYEGFCRAPENRSWLEDFALFSALKLAHEGQEWARWPAPLRDRDPAALHRWEAHHEDEVDFHRFCQWLFTLQWDALRSHARTHGVQIVGDMPIFVAGDSADVWAHPTQFHLTEDGAPTHIAGVPPDYFSKTGQRWGNPLYRWEVMARDGYRWWVERFRRALRQVDIIRIDHFRGFAAYWAIPAAEETAVNGRWVRGPGAHFFAQVKAQLGELPLIAEDLGTITPDVTELRNRFGLPGMKILQFAYSDPQNAYLPHNYETPNCVVYSGTHDNDTTHGWWASLKPAERKAVRGWIGTTEKDIAWALLREAVASTARIAIHPAQDLLSLPTAARMNAPGATEGNWGWRLEGGALTPELALRLRELCHRFGRAPAPASAEAAAPAAEG